MSENEKEFENAKGYLLAMVEGIKEATFYKRWVYCFILAFFPKVIIEVIKKFDYINFKIWKENDRV